MSEETFTCDVCNKNEAVGVAAIPMIPVSVSYCRECLEANAHPMWALVGNTAMMYSGEGDVLADTNEAWQKMVNDTLDHLDITLEEFTRDVIEAKKGVDNAFKPTAEEELLRTGWNLIAGSREWNLDDDEAKEWVVAAELWRGVYYDYLAKNPGLMIGEKI